MIWVSIATRTTCVDTSSERYALLFCFVAVTDWRDGTAASFRAALRQAFIDMQHMVIAAVKENPKITDVPNLKEKARM